MTKKEALTKMWNHLLSLQKGFAFSHQKKRVRFENGEYCYLDLEMYNIEIHALVLINVRTGRPKTAELMQMQRLVDYYNRREKYPHETPSIGLVVNNTKDETFISFIGVTEEQKSIGRYA